MAFDRTLPLSAIDWKPQEYTYLNERRDIYDNLFFTNSAVPTFSNGISGVRDLINTNNHVLILTEPIEVDNRINIFPSTFEDQLSGTSYSDTSVSNEVIETSGLWVQHIIHYSLEDENNHFNVFTIPLNSEEYYKIHPNVSETAIVLSKKKDYIDVECLPDIVTTFSVESSAILSSVFKFSKQGETFCESDKISSDHAVYWLSGNECSKKWVETSLLGNYKTSSVDVSSPLPSGVYQYQRYGVTENSKTRNALVPKLCITNFFNLSSEVTLYGNLIDANQYALDGKEYLQINWENPEYTYENELKTDLSFSCLIRPKGNSNGGAIVSNRSTGKTSGISLIYNTGFESFIKTIPFENNVYSFNSNNLKISEKTFENSNIELIAYGPDGSGIRWLYDSTLNQIHRLDLDNIALVRIELDVNDEIKHIETDFQNNLWVMNRTKQYFACYNNNGQLTKTIPFSLFPPIRQWDTFYIPVIGNTPIPTYGTVTDFDSSGNLYRLVGMNIRKNDDIFYSFKKTVQDFFVDLENRVWVFYDKNRIAIIDHTGILLSDKEIIKSIDNERNARISGWNNRGMFSAQVLLLDNNIILEIDESLNVIYKSDLNITCERNYAFSFRGDWTGFKIGKRQNYINHSLYRGFASVNNPFVTLDFSYNCSPESSDPVQHGIFREHVPYKPYTKSHEWNGVGFVVDNHNGKCSIFINGANVMTKTFPKMNRLIRHEFPDNNRYNPLLIGAYNGKIGIISTHTGKEDENLQASVANLFIYSKALTNGNMRTIFTDDLYSVLGLDVFKSLTLSIPSKTQHHIVRFDNFLKNSFPGIQSNYFDINIYNSELDSTTQNTIEKLMIDQIEKVIPSHVSLRRINWK